jgi:hypothetical protein
LTSSIAENINSFDWLGMPGDVARHATAAMPVISCGARHDDDVANDSIEFDLIYQSAMAGCHFNDARLVA